MPNKIIHIQWQGPFKLPDVKKFSNEETDYGIYQIYGAHPVFGNNALLYIGKAGEQTFADRVNRQYWINWQENEGKVQIHIGRLAGSATPSMNEWGRQIDVAEALLITAHKPAQNASGVGDLSGKTDKAARGFHVINWGDYRDLLPEVSGERWSSKPCDLPDYKVYGEH